jgi:hypothetical protein
VIVAAVPTVGWPLIATLEIAVKLPLITAGLALDVDVPSTYPGAETVSTTRSVEPTSAATGVYVFDVAPAMFEQEFPELSHSRHWYVRDVVDGE